MDAHVPAEGAQRVPTREPDPAAYGRMPAPPPRSGKAAPVVVPVRPRSMDFAVRTMQAGAVLSVVSIIAGLLTRDSIRARVTEQIRRTTPTASTAEIDQAVVVGLVGMAIWGLFIAMLWLTMSWANGRGAGWARIMATVLFVIGAFLAYGSYTQAAPALTKAIEALSVAIGAATMYLLYRPESSDYYRKMKAIPPA